jgi:hypothetical protein
MEYTPPARDVSDRMASRLDAKTERVAAAPAGMKPAAKPEPETVPGEAEVVNEPASADGAKVELF